MRDLDPLLVIELMRCPHGVQGLAVSGDASHSSTKLAGRCCGQWTTVRRWRVSAADMRAAVDLESDIARARYKRL